MIKSSFHTFNKKQKKELLMGFLGVSERSFYRLVDSDIVLKKCYSLNKTINLGLVKDAKEENLRANTQLTLVKLERETMLAKQESYELVDIDHLGDSVKKCLVEGLERYKNEPETPKEEIFSQSFYKLISLISPDDVNEK